MCVAKMTDKRPNRQTINSIYKLIIFCQPPLDPFAGKTKALFYVLSALPELAGITILLAYNLRDDFDIPESSGRSAQNKRSFSNSADGDMQMDERSHV